MLPIQLSVFYFTVRYIGCISSSRWGGVLGGFFVYRAAILDRFFVKMMGYKMEHSFLRNDLD